MEKEFAGNGSKRLTSKRRSRHMPWSKNISMQDRVNIVAPLAKMVAARKQKLREEQSRSQAQPTNEAKDSQSSHELPQSRERINVDAI